MKSTKAWVTNPPSLKSPLTLARRLRLGSLGLCFGIGEAQPSPWPPRNSKKGGLVRAQAGGRGGEPLGTGMGMAQRQGQGREPGDVFRGLPDNLAYRLAFTPLPPWSVRCSRPSPLTGCSWRAACSGRSAAELKCSDFLKLLPRWKGVF